MNFKSVACLGLGMALCAQGVTGDIGQDYIYEVESSAVRRGMWSGITGASAAISVGSSLGWYINQHVLHIAQQWAPQEQLEKPVATKEQLLLGNLALFATIASYIGTYLATYYTIKAIERYTECGEFNPIYRPEPKLIMHDENGNPNYVILFNENEVHE